MFPLSCLVRFTNVHNLVKLFGKGRHELNKGYIDYGIHLRKLNTLVITR